MICSDIFVSLIMHALLLQREFVLKKKMLIFWFFLFMIWYYSILLQQCIRTIHNDRYRYVNENFLKNFMTLILQLHNFFGQIMRQISNYFIWLLVYNTSPAFYTTSKSLFRKYKKVPFLVPCIGTTYLTAIFNFFFCQCHYCKSKQAKKASKLTKLLCDKTLYLFDLPRRNNSI